jgi:hypothetical protein
MDANARELFLLPRGEKVAGGRMRGRPSLPLSGVFQSGAQHRTPRRWRESRASFFAGSIRTRPSYFVIDYEGGCTRTIRPPRLARREVVRTAPKGQHAIARGVTPVFLRCRPGALHRAVSCRPAGAWPSGFWFAPWVRFGARFCVFSETKRRSIHIPVHRRRRCGRGLGQCP